jgi:outer membrane cobalamin receptor
MSSVTFRFSTAAALVLTLAACGATRREPDLKPRHSARLITREDIERTGATDGYEALKRAGSYLILGERKGGDIRASERGRSSIILSPQILLVVDEVMMMDLNTLRDIRADAIEWMRVMSGAEATPIYGTPASNGVLVVRTRIPLDK